MDPIDTIRQLFPLAPRRPLPPVAREVMRVTARAWNIVPPPPRLQALRGPAAPLRQAA